MPARVGTASARVTASSSRGRSSAATGSASVAIDCRGTLTVTDAYNNRVQQFALAAPATTLAGPRIAIESLRLFLLWLMGFAGAFVFIEPSPYEIVGVVEALGDRVALLGGGAAPLLRGDHVAGAERGEAD